MDIFDIRARAFQLAQEFRPNDGLEQTIRNARQIADFIEKNVTPAAPTLAAKA